MPRFVRNGAAAPALVWAPEPNATIDRLAFLAARPYLLHRARPWWTRALAAMEAGGGTPNMGYRGAETARLPSGHVMTDEVVNARMADYCFACEELASRLSVDESRKLRESGQLPSWFFGELERAVRARRAKHLGNGY